MSFNTFTCLTLSLASSIRQFKKNKNKRDVLSVSQIAAQIFQVKTSYERIISYNIYRNSIFFIFYIFALISFELNYLQSHTLVMNALVSMQYHLSFYLKMRIL